MVRHLSSGDINFFIDLIRVFEEVFEMKDFKLPGKKHLEALLRNPDFNVFVVLSDGNVVGGLTSYTMASYYSGSSEIYIYDMGILAEHQRKGYGRQLIKALGDFCKEKGIQTAFVEALEADGHAVEFYRSTGGRPERVVHFNYSFD